MSLLFGSPLSVLADGSIEFEEVLPLLKDRPDLKQAVKDVEFHESGSARRIGYKVCPALAGERVGPYIFRAWERVLGPGGGRYVEVRISTDVKFFDANGQMVAEVIGDEWKGEDQMENATSLVEEVVALTITPI